VLATLLILFVAVPLLELALLIWIGQHLGVVSTIVLVVVTGILGATLARHQGLATLGRFRRSLQEGILPHRELVEGILILVAAAVLLTPGLLTDTAGFLLLIPPLRRRLGEALLLRIRRRLVVTVPGKPPPGTVDVEFEVRDPRIER